MNNMGPGLGEVAYNFKTVSDMGKLLSALAMLLGRLEVFTILVLLSPSFWRR
jgi:trk system potassium uptake protein TrkH